MRRFIITLAILFALPAFVTAQQPTAWNFRYEDKGDGTIDLLFDAQIEDPWYIYSTEKIQGGALPTSFSVSSPSGYELIGNLIDVTSPKVKMDEGFGLEVKVFEHEATFLQKIRRISDGALKIEGILTFQSCNGGECMLDEIDAVFSIPGGDTAVTVTPADGTTDNEGMLSFLLIALAAGLAGVFTPCVFPMIPMTIGFFIGGSGDKRAGIVKGIVFGLSVILIYTLVGLLVAIFKSTSATDIMGTHWIPNFLFAILFILFAISFFGAFEITLPSGLANKADGHADKGGYIASFFVAAAMVIVSFSCTGPFVGSILAASVIGGLAIKPVLGMTFFGLGFSFPFILFSFFPSLMKKMPKSGGWLNVVKVVFAFILLAFSFKYLATVDAWFGWGVFSRAVVLSIWIVIAVLMGFYFLGKIKTSHDSDVPYASTWRILFATVSFSFAVYLIPGLFGAPLSGLSGILPPKDGSTIEQGLQPAYNAATQEAGLTKGLCGDAKYAAANNRAPYGLNSYYEVEQAIECAKELDLPILLAFKSHTCSGCKVMEANVWSDPQVLDILSNKVVLAILYIDDRTELPENEQTVSVIDGKIKNTLGRKLRDYQVSRYNVASQPFYVMIDHNEVSLTDPVAECSVEEYLTFLKKGIENYNAL